MFRVILFITVLAQALCGQGLEYVKANYTKTEHLIAMRDGKHLFTAVYSPKDDSHTYPFLLTRTPYSVAPYGEDQYRENLGPSPQFGKEGYIFVYQDVRGRYQSEGEFLEMTPQHDRKSGPADFDESSDTYDTIEWLVHHIPNNNGKAGLYGISYPGFYAAAGMIDAHPALKAVSPQAPVTDLYMGDDAYHNGAFYLAANFGFYTGFEERKGDPAPPQRRVPFNFGTPDGYDFYLRMGPLSNSDERYFKHANHYWSDMIKHPNYDEFWKARNLVPHIRNIKPAVMVVGGWFDAEDLAGPLQVFRAVEKTSSGTPNMLVEGPWQHGGWSRTEGASLGDVQFGQKTSETFREKIELPFFEFHLKSKGKDEFPKAWVFQTGTNQWRKYSAWPPKESTSQRLYFGANGALSFTPAPAQGSDEYISDPAKPVPFVSYTTDDMDPAYMTGDQRFAASRTDVLVYQTEPLEQDVTIVGPLSPTLRVSTTGTDSDWVVKLIDVYPGNYPDPTPNPKGVRMAGYEQLIRGEPFRGKFRHNFEKPEPFQPGRAETIAFTMPDVCHVFRRGHRIMVQIQSSWFPLIDRNPQQFLDIPNARPAEFQKAAERVYHGGDAPSFLQVNVIQ